MARYRLTEPAYINETLYRAGEVVETSLPPGPHMVPAVDSRGVECPEARAAKDAVGAAKPNGLADPRWVGDLVNGNLSSQGQPVMKPMFDQQTPVGLLVDEGGQVRGVTAGVGSGDPGDGSHNPDGKVGVAPPSAAALPSRVPPPPGSGPEPMNLIPQAPLVPSLLVDQVQEQFRAQVMATDTLQADHAALQADHADLDQAHQALLNDHDTAKAAADAAKAQAADLQAQLDAANARAEAAEKAHAQVQADLDAATAPSDPTPKKKGKGGGDDAPDA